MLYKLALQDTVISIAYQYFRAVVGVYGHHVSEQETDLNEINQRHRVHEVTSPVPRLTVMEWK